MTSSYDMETPRDDATSIAAIHQALDLGKTLIGTADAYGPITKEELVDRALSGAACSGGSASLGWEVISGYATEVGR